MIQDYEMENNKCVICGETSNNKPLCQSCYKLYKNYFNNEVDLSYCNKNLGPALIKLLAYLDRMEDEYDWEDNSPFIFDLIETIKTHYKNLEKENKELEKQILHLINNLDEKPTIKERNEFQNIDPRKKWPTEHRCTDGHYVRSRAEVIIDNWLFNNKIRHVYEKQVIFPNGEKALCDFYLPDYNIYIEFWGKQEDYYIKRKKTKTELYKTLKKDILIELDDKSLSNIDDKLNEYLKLGF